MGILPIILIFGVFYFLLIRPQKKKMKEQQEMVNNLKKGDKVLNGGGIYGRITSLKGKQAEVEIATGTRVTINKSSLSRIQPIEAEVVKK
jgi:preprotein translocase subunit YajC